MLLYSCSFDSLTSRIKCNVFPFNEPRSSSQMRTIHSNMTLLPPHAGIPSRSRNNFSCVTPLVDGRIMFSLASEGFVSSQTMSTGLLAVWDPAKKVCKQLAGPSCDAECCPRCECCPEKVLCPHQNGQRRHGHPLYMGVVQLADGRVVSCSDEGVRVWV